ncbi:MAG: bifunctional riboflavin kinase/FAD synthetase [Gemmatimonadetes bacterium]|nr:bifunctional riboflavin kinase/FAD synthetase [Gemmatimonadota bacterium]MCB9504915.1 bifunctional riboflavin kinase/FAD synthetase [Gemmatimonadales bacterium]MCA9762921.1 bifunctional riboflavin kinase/FAD synthetase [Gemmatimonadota bacterium]MCA9768700.1 bifunctional riboflavin kinase/FAD synthetase [Gemmatimonadota bacterium]MCB9518235.1 bifunctional riboflavin kinase/FAD synthetase [Gemmatimonadales bacterium]
MTPLAPPPAGTVVTVGTFDGVHRGHRAVLDEIAARARDRQRASVLVTFEPHPLAVVNPAAAPPRLTTAAERLEVLATCELDRVVILRFDRAMAGLAPDAFVEEVLVGRCGMRELVIGHDHGFGRGRQGDVETLRVLGDRMGFAVDVVAPVAGGGGQPVSSTSIRRAIAGGDLATAARQLGRPYTVSGRVRHGEARGRTLGFPTLNLGIAADKLLPPDGVWVVRVETPAGRFGGMMNQGHRPTFDDGRRLLEIHLLDVEVALYDRMVRVEWLAPLRPIRRFDGADALRLQLEDDARRARAILAGAHDDLDAPLTAPE